MKHMTATEAAKRLMAHKRKAVSAFDKAFMEPIVDRLMELMVGDDELIDLPKKDTKT